MIEIILDAAGIFLALVVVVLAGFAFRRRFLQRRGGTFDCSVRLRDRVSGKGWVLGIARYSGDSVEWFRVFSFSPRPKRRFSRNDLVVRARREPLTTEAVGLYAGHVVVECVRSDGTVVELAMAEDALTGFLAWLEAAPPGRARGPLTR
jgi:hypothetical protein